MSSLTALADRLRDIKMNADMAACDETLSEHQRESLEWTSKEANEIEVALRQHAAGGWQPIETAPKDGTRILIAMEDGGIRAACWNEEFHHKWDEEKDEDYYEGAWTDDAVASWGYEEFVEYHPTHWQPLPTPPHTD